MNRYVAFLRAINVGGHVVKMDRLRELFKQMGFENVETFIASGNVLFDSSSTNADALEKQIEAGLEAALGYAVGTFVRTPHEIAAVSEFEYREEDWKVWVAFLKRPLSDDMLARALALETDSERLSANGREFYWLFNVPYSESTVATPRGKLSGRISRSRNMTTVRKIAAKLS